ncbi:MAG: hypothetical protein AB4080_11305 [Trichodesmium sp.]
MPKYRLFVHLLDLKVVADLVRIELPHIILLIQPIILRGKFISIYYRWLMLGLRVKPNLLLSRLILELSREELLAKFL